MKIYTLGYEKRDIQQYVEILKNAGVTILVDVRETAWSYKRDFCKMKLRNTVEDKGILYVHIKELGNPKIFRKSELSPADILLKYRSYLDDTRSGLDVLLNLILHGDQADQYLCLTCFEKDYATCHRSVIAEYMQQSINNLRIIHL